MNHQMISVFSILEFLIILLESLYRFGLLLMPFYEVFSGTIW
jgi:hypothetical protein